MNKMRFITYLFFLIIAGGCSEPKNELTAEDQVLRFLTSPEYEMLSLQDRSVWTREEWQEYVSKAKALGIGITPTPKPKLSPTNKYFELERYLHEFVTFNISNVRNVSDGEQVVTVTVSWPSVLEEVFFFKESLMGIGIIEEKISNIQSAYDRGLLTPSAINLITSDEEYTYTVVPDGIFFDVAKIQERIDKRSEAKQLFDHLTYIDSYDLDFEWYSLDYSKLISQIETLRKISIQQIEADISLLEAALLLANELIPEASHYTELTTLGKLYQARVLLESDAAYSQGLTFARATVAEAQNRQGIHLFFDWSFSGENLPHEAVSAGVQARYFDGDGVQIGSENIMYTTIYVKNGNRGGSIGRIIENQNIARRVSSVELRYLMPASAPRFACKFNQAVECDPR